MDKELLTRGGAGPVGLPEDDVEIPGIGTVRVRGMNRGEMIEVGRLSDKHGQAYAERYLLSACMLDPVMTMQDVKDWQDAGPGMECHPVVERVNELSGAGKVAEKSGLLELRDQPDVGV